MYTDVLRCWKGKRRVAVDVGAHMGLWTRLLAADFANVLAFEPNAENRECLLYNLRDVKNVTVSDAALGSVNQELAQTLPGGGNSGMWHMAPGTGIQVGLLDQLGLTEVDLIKIDVEGYEGHVVKGALATIAHSKPLIVFEDNGTGPRYFGKDWLDPKPLLRALGYRKRLRWRRDEVWTHPSP